MLSIPFWGLPLGQEKSAEIKIPSEVFGKTENEFLYILKCSERAKMDFQRFRSVRKGFSSSFECFYIIIKGDFEVIAPQNRLFFIC